MGIIVVSGENSNVVRNSVDIIRVVRLVCLFICMFEVFLVKVVVLLVFSSELVMIVVLLVSSVWLKCFCVFGSFSRLVWLIMLYRVLVVLNIFISMNISIICSSIVIGVLLLWCSRFGRFSCRKVGVRFGGSEIRFWYCMLFNV